MSDTLDAQVAPPAPSPVAAPAKKAAKKAPKPARDTAPRSPGRPSNIEKLGDQLGTQLTAIGALVMLANQADGEAVVRRAPELGDALAKLAEQNPRVRRLLEGGLTSSAWMGVAIAFGGLGLEIARNHDVKLRPKPKPAPELVDEDAPPAGGLGNVIDLAASWAPQPNGSPS